ncbi:Ger(x)C family spore germination protein [Caldisalinibacter kiritimatiensis]|uniref:Spore germination B3 n=1 Tax=Caldisalinibacter kiritimatiensis TaxID=1304284 RepID=R1CYM6_9FIRM|nr:Ger(x)C family spore germination protein [Caldisalinibacter kiritimatiensis]EOD01684.1 spore germination B3 [Caldisalinibacter kiritimatiensis]
MVKNYKILLFLLMILVLSGCWDKVEIDDRAFVSTVGIDLYKGEREKDTEGKGQIEKPKDSSRNRYTITYVFPNLDSIGKNAVSDKRRFVFSSVGSNPYQTTRQLSTQLDKVMFFKHMKTLIIGECVSRNADYFKEIIDSVERNFEISRKTNVMIAEGQAKEVIKIEPETKPDTGALLSQISENQNTARFNPQTLGDMLISLHFDGSTVVPRVIPGKDNIKVAGSAVIKDYRLVGWLGELENRAIMFVKDQVKGSIADVEYKGIVVPYIITDSSTKKTIELKEGNITADIFIGMEGFVEQYALDAEVDLLDEKTISAIEKLVEDEIQKEIEGTVKKLQKEFKADVIGIDMYISKFKPNLWEEIKNDWDEIFPEMNIKVTVDAKLRRVGMTK